MTIRTRIQFIASFMAVLTALYAAPAQAQPQVVCNIVAADETYQTVHQPQENPLKMNSVDTTHGFRFSGILLDKPSKFKSYVYYDSKDRFVLISKQERVLTDKQCGEKLWVDQSYSPYLENYLSHECEYRCAP
jgi:hypothetical protein